MFGVDVCVGYGNRYLVLVLVSGMYFDIWCWCLCWIWKSVLVGNSVDTETDIWCLY